MKIPASRILIALLVMLGFAGSAEAPRAIAVRFDRIEAEAALAIFEKQAAGKEVTDRTVKRCSPPPDTSPERTGYCDER